MTEKILVILWSLIAVIVGILLGNGEVYFFNKCPGSWLCDYGEEPTEELLNPTHQRIRSTPWKYYFSALFIILGIFLFNKDWQMAIVVLCVVWLLIQISISDIKYMVIPDQFTLLIAVSSLGLIPYKSDPLDFVWGGMVGFFVMLVVAILGKLFYRRDSVGGGDIKLFLALGMVTGVYGVLIVFALTALISSGHFIFQLMTKTAKITDVKPMGPYIAISSSIYLVFLYGIEELFFL